MAVTQYIGSRYVPLFADPIEWSNQNTYEPLTIVLYQGNSFTSKQAVPKGIDITNEEFWAVTGNYNAQVEQYRRDTLALGRKLPSTEFDETNTVKAYVDGIDSALQESIVDLASLLPSEDFTEQNTVKSYIDSTAATIVSDMTESLSNAIEESTSNAYVGRHGAKEKTLGLPWQSIIDEIIEDGAVIDFGSGIWFIDTPIQIPVNSVKAIAGSGALLIAYNNDAIIRIVTSDVTSAERFMRVSGLTFDGRSTCAVGLSNNSGSGNTLHVFDCQFRNFTTTCLDNRNAIGIMVSSCIFIDATVAESLTPNCTGIVTSTDNQIIGCKFFGLLTGIVMDSGQVTGCYFWSKTDGIETTAIAKKDTTLNSTGIVVTNCEFDCMIRCFRTIAPCAINNNRFYWNNSDVANIENAYIFTFAPTSNISMLQIEFNDNAIIPTTLGYDVYSFDVVGTMVFSRFGFNSKGCYIRNFFSLTSEQLSRYHITAGISFKGFTTSDWYQSNTFCGSTFAPATTGNPELHIINYDSGGCELFKYASGIYAFKKIAASGANQPMIAWDNTNKKGILGQKIWTINEIHVGVAPINIDWDFITEPPEDYSNYNVVVAS